MGNMTRDETRRGFEICKIAPHVQLQAAYDAKLEGCSDQVAAERSEIPYWQLLIMLELGAQGHPAWEPVYKTFKRKKAESLGEVEKADYNSALAGPGKSRDRVMIREAPDIYEPLIRGEQGGGLPPGVKIQVAQFAVEPSVSSTPVVEGELLPTDAVTVEDKDG